VTFLATTGQPPGDDKDSLQETTAFEPADDHESKGKTEEPPPQGAGTTGQPPADDKDS